VAHKAARDGGTTVHLRVARPTELGADEQRAWHAFQRADPTLASPFLTLEFARAVDTVRDDARVGVVDDGADVAAFFAFSVEGRAGAPLGVSISDAQALVTRTEFEWSARDLVRSADLDVWTFDHLVPTQRPFVPFHRARHRSPVVDLRGGHERYLATARAGSKDVLAQVARRRRKLAREVGDVTMEWQAADTDALEILFEWKSAQYRETAVWDRFAQPWIVHVVRLLASTREEALTGLLSTLRAAGELVAVHFGLLGRDRLAWWFPAYNQKFASYSPGLILLLDLISEAAARGVAFVDLGRGEHHYKLRVATGAYEVAEGSVPAG
jgi:CelD/BcsL family acetyltransferase involved in cellulose biosynthesis